MRRVPIRGCVKLNSDDVVTTHCSIAVCGGVVQYDYGRFLVGYSYDIFARNVVMVVFCSTLCDIQLIVNRLFAKVEID